MNSDLQRMHQDEWLADLMATDEPRGHGGDAMRRAPFCVLGRAARLGGLTLNGRIRDYKIVEEWLGISDAMCCKLFGRSDHDEPFADIAAWFKEQRDLHDGDLSEWSERD